MSESPVPLYKPASPSHSELFTVRIWWEDLSKGRVEWRGQVQHVTSGQGGYFRDWPALIALIQKMLPEGGNQGRDPPGLNFSE